MEKQPLTDEELDKLKSLLSEDSYNFYERQFKNQLDLFPEQTKLIDCPLELTLNLSINVLEQDEEGTNIGSAGLSNYTYHIPVPSGEDHQKYIDTFISHFEKAIVTASEQTEKTLTEEKNDTNG